MEKEITPVEALGKIQHFMTTPFTPLEECMEGVLSLKKVGIAENPAISSYLEIVGIRIGPQLLGRIAIADATLGIVQNHKTTQDLVKDYLSMAYTLKLNSDELIGPKLVEFAAKHTPELIPPTPSPALEPTPQSPTRPENPTDATAERKNQIINQAIAVFDRIIDTTGQLRFGDQQYLKSVKESLYSLQNQVMTNHYRDREIATNLIAQAQERTNQILYNLNPKLDKLEEESNVFGIKSEPHREEIEGLLKKASQDTDPTRAATLANQAIELFNRVVNDLGNNRHEQREERKRIEQTTKEDEQSIGHNISSLNINIENTTLESLKIFSRKLAKDVDTVSGPLSTRDEEFFGQLTAGKHTFRELVAELLSIQPAPEKTEARKDYTPFTLEQIFQTGIEKVFEKSLPIASVLGLALHRKPDHMNQNEYEQGIIQKTKYIKACISTLGSNPKTHGLKAYALLGVGSRQMAFLLEDGTVFKLASSEETYQWQDDWGKRPFDMPMTYGGKINYGEGKQLTWYIQPFIQIIQPGEEGSEKRKVADAATQQAAQEYFAQGYYLGDRRTYQLGYDAAGKRWLADYGAVYKLNDFPKIQEIGLSLEDYDLIKRKNFPEYRPGYKEAQERDALLVFQQLGEQKFRAWHGEEIYEKFKSIFVKEDPLSTVENETPEQKAERLVEHIIRAELDSFQEYTYFSVRDGDRLVTSRNTQLGSDEQGHKPYDIITWPKDSQKISRSSNISHTIAQLFGPDLIRNDMGGTTPKNRGELYCVVGKNEGKIVIQGGSVHMDKYSRYIANASKLVFDSEEAANEYLKWLMETPQAYLFVFSRALGTYDTQGKLQKEFKHPHKFSPLTVRSIRIKDLRDENSANL